MIAVLCLSPAFKRKSLLLLCATAGPQAFEMADCRLSSIEGQNVCLCVSGPGENVWLRAVNDLLNLRWSFVSAVCFCRWWSFAG